MNHLQADNCLYTLHFEKRLVDTSDILHIANNEWPIEWADLYTAQRWIKWKPILVRTKCCVRNVFVCMRDCWSCVSHLEHLLQIVGIRITMEITLCSLALLHYRLLMSRKKRRTIITMETLCMW